MKIALSQTSFRLGDFDNNYKKLLESLEKAIQQKADLLVFPEGGLWGYSPQDFLYHKRFYKIQDQKIRRLKKKLPDSFKLLLPGFRSYEKKLQNGVFLLEKNKEIFFAKEYLPDEGVFFESRWFQKGQIKNNFFYCKKKRIQLLICEDFWRASGYKKSDILIVVNASPYSVNKQKLRLKRLKLLAKKTKQGAVYLNLAGAQDSLIFDGASLAVNAKGEKVWQGDFFRPDFTTLQTPFDKKAKAGGSLTLQAQRERALILGIKEFFFQTGFSKACIGLSGGVDSALVSYLAVQALGAENILAYFLPTRYTRKISFQIVEELSQKLKIKVIQKNMDPLFEFCLKQFFDKKLKPLTRQNLQSRLRMLFLMTQSNEHSCLLLSAGNKSELAMGYSTLYGDLSGALCPIGDILKTELYDLVSFINQQKAVFPKKLILREPSAELRFNQIDSQDLAPYKELDSFLSDFLKSRDSKKTEWVKKMKNQEFKRKQAPPILNLTEQDLGKSWRYPIANCFPLD